MFVVGFQFGSDDSMMKFGRSVPFGCESNEERHRAKKKPHKLPVCLFDLTLKPICECSKNFGVDAVVVGHFSLSHLNHHLERRALIIQPDSLNYDHCAL